METPVQIITRIYPAYARREIEAGLDHFHDGVCFVWNIDRSALPDGSVCHGKPAFVDRLQQLAADWQFDRYEFVDAFSEGDRAASRVALEVTSRRTGKTGVTELGHYWTFRDGKVSKLIEFFDTASMLQLSGCVLAAPDSTSQVAASST